MKMTSATTALQLPMTHVLVNPLSPPETASAVLLISLWIQHSEALLLGICHL